MERLTRQSAALTLTLMLALATVAMSAPKSERSRKYITIEGRVLEVNPAARTMIVADAWSKTLYRVNVPKGESFRITFGMNMKTTEPGIDLVRRSDRVRVRCIRTEKEHLARLDDGRTVVVMTAAL